MRTSLDHLALRFSEGCTPDHGWRVCFLSLVAIALLTWQFGCIALVALIGSLIGLAIHQMASQGARALRSAISEVSFYCLRNRAEFRELMAVLTALAARSFHKLARQSFEAVVAVLDGLGIAHVALSPRLCPYPVLSRA